MTLERQTISIPIGIGQTDHEAPPYLEGNALSRDVRFPKRGRADKRLSREVLPASPIVGLPLGGGGSGTIADARGIAGVYSAGTAQYYDQEIEEWTPRNESDPRLSDVRISSILRGRRMSVLPSMAIVGNTMCVCWAEIDSTGYVLVTQPGIPVQNVVAFYDISGDTPALLSGPTVTGYYRGAHVIALETGTSDECFVMIGEVTDDQMGWSRYTLAAGDYTFSSITGLPVRSGINRGFDACGHPRNDVTAGANRRAYAVWKRAAGTSVVSIGATGGATTATIATAGRVDGICCAVDVFSQTLMIGQTDGTCYTVPCASIGTPESPLATVAVPAGLTVRRVTFMPRGGVSSGTVFCMSDRYAPLPGAALTAPQVWGTWCYNINAGSGIHLANLVIAGKSVMQAQGTYAYPFGGYLPVQGNASRRIFFVSLDETGSVATIPDHSVTVAAMSDNAWCESNFFNDLTPTSWTMPFGNDADGRIHFVYPRVTSLFPGSTTRFPFVGVNGIGLDHVRCAPIYMTPRRTAQTQDVTFISSGAGIACADSLMTAEMTPQRADTPFLTDIVVADAPFFPATGGALPYYVAVGWGWYDQSGREHRGDISPPTSAPIDSMVLAPAKTTPYLWAVPYPAHDAHLTGGSRQMFLDVYLSDPSDSSTLRRIARLVDPDSDSRVPDCKVFYFNFGTSVPSATYPNSLVNFIVSVTAFPSLPEPYTNTELAAVAPAAMVSVTSSQSRLWAISAEALFSVQVTKPLVAAYAPEFATELAIDIPAEGGECVGLASVDDKIVVFKRDRIFVIYGEPGDASGGNSTLQLPRLVSSDVGCISEASIVEGPFGVAFQSARGIVVLGRDLGLTNIGERVAEQVAGKILAGSLVPSASEVRWTIGERGVSGSTVYEWVTTGTRVVWSYDLDQWSQRVDNATQEVIRRGVPWALDNGFVAVEQDSEAAWSVAGYGVKIVSPWVRVAGVEAFQRVWRAVVLLVHYTGHVRISIAYDYNDEDVESHEFLESVCIAERAPNGRLELSVRPERQKCSAIRISVEEIPTAQEPPFPTIGEGISVVSLDLECGVKSGTSRRRLSNAQKG